jgi:hypothetical protein
MDDYGPGYGPLTLVNNRSTYVSQLFEDLDMDQHSYVVNYSSNGLRTTHSVELSVAVESEASDAVVVEP